MLLLLNELSPSGMGLRGCNVVGPHSAGGIGFWGEKKGECALAYIAESLCMDRQYGESAGGNSLYIMHHLRSDFRFSALWVTVSSGTAGWHIIGNCRESLPILQHFFFLLPASISELMRLLLLKFWLNGLHSMVRMVENQ